VLNRLLSRDSYEVHLSQITAGARDSGNIRLLQGGSGIYISQSTRRERQSRKQATRDELSYIAYGYLTTTGKKFWLTSATATAKRTASRRRRSAPPRHRITASDNLARAPGADRLDRLSPAGGRRSGEREREAGRRQLRRPGGR
jgi:hypothetical protein